MPCMNPEHDHFDESLLTDAQRDRVAKGRETMDLIDALPGDEERVLLADSLATGVYNSLHLAVEALTEGDVQRALGMVLTGSSLASLTGITLRSMTDTHEDWQKTGDRRVDAIIAKFSEAVDSAQPTGYLRPEDLPPEVAERVMAGTSTAEDQEVIRQVAIEKGLITEDDDFAAVAHDEATGETHLVEAQEEPPQTGLYL